MNSPNASQDLICEEVANLIPAYALGAADPEERMLVEAYLSRCPKAQAMLEVYQEITANLLFSSPPMDAPPQVRERIRAAIAQGTLVDSLVSPNTATSAREGQGWWPRLFARLAARRWNTAPVIVALLLLALFAFGYFNQQINELRQVNETLLEMLDEQSELVAQQTEVLVLLGAGNSQRVELPPLEDSYPTMLAAVLYDPERTEMFLYVEHFPQLPPDKVYQVWLIQGEKRTSGGTFKVDKEGNGVLFIHTSDAVKSYEAVGITPEPVGGSPGPTAPPVVRGPI